MICWLSLVGLPAAVIIPNLILRSVGSDLWLLVTVLLTLLLVTVRLYSMRWGIELTATHLISRWGRRKAIPWDQVQGLAVQQLFGWRTLEVITDDGKRQRLWAPCSFWVIGRAAFDAQHQLIGQWWVDHRGAQWQPMPVTPWGAPPG